MILKPYFKPAVGLCILILLIVYATTTKGDIDIIINGDKYVTVARVDKFYINRSFNHYYYHYYYNGIKYSSIEDIDNFSGQQCVGKYFTVEISSKKPKYARILLANEVRDSTKIVDAGFSLQYIKY